MEELACIKALGQGVGDRVQRRTKEAGLNGRWGRGGARATVRSKTRGCRAW